MFRIQQLQRIQRERYLHGSAGRFHTGSNVDVIPDDVVNEARLSNNPGDHVARVNTNPALPLLI